MRLQPKKAIQADLATQRKQQIDEGVKLARKVDTIRETLVEEGGNLQRFRTETVAIVQADIDRYLRAKEELIGEVRTLEKRRSDALIPVDAEWEKIRLVADKMTKRELAIVLDRERLTEREREIEASEKETLNEKGRATDLRRMASEHLVSADETLKEAREASAEMRNKAQVVLFAAELKEREVDLKEKEIKKREDEVAKTKQRQTAKDQEQAMHDRTIKDKYETLERTIKRISKHA